MLWLMQVISLCWYWYDNTSFWRNSALVFGQHIDMSIYWIAPSNIILSIYCCQISKFAGGVPALIDRRHRQLDPISVCSVSSTALSQPLHHVYLSHTYGVFFMCYLISIKIILSNIVFFCMPFCILQTILEGCVGVLVGEILVFF